MEKRRMIKNKSSGSFNRDDASGSAELYNPNSLIALPDHILQNIFEFLDLADTKSFAESCLKFNKIFSSRRNLDKIWMQDPESEFLYPSFVNNLRPYSGLSWNCNRVKKIVKHLLKHLAPSLTSLRIMRDDRSDNIGDLLTSRSFLDTLPYFTNLTQLDLDVSYHFLTDHMLKTKQQTVELIEMKNLAYMKLNVELFSYLDGRYINFAETKNIQIIKINTFSYESNQDNEMSQVLQAFRKLRALLSNQKNLKTLHLLERTVFSIFDSPLSIPSKLENLELKRKYERLSIQQQENFCDFITGQDQLNRMLCEFDFDHAKSDKMERYLNGRLNMPLKVQYINLHRRSNSDAYESNAFSVKDLIQSTSSDQPNLLTEELHMKVDVSFIKMSQVATLIARMFPNLKLIKIENDCTRDQKADNFSALSNMKNLETLGLDNFSSENLRSITIPTLKRFEYEYRCGPKPEKLAKPADLIDFFVRHKNIQELDIFITGLPCSQKSKKSIEKIGEYAVEKLKKLSVYECRVYNNYIQDWSAASLTPHFIRKHAKQGFVLKHRSISPVFPIMEIMKRYDNEVVQKNGKKWQLVDIH